MRAGGNLAALELLIEKEEFMPKNNLILDSFKTFENPIKSFECKPLFGGLCYSSEKYKCCVNGKNYFVRTLSGSLQEKFNEVKSNLIASEVNIAPKVYFSSIERSILITAYVEGKTLLLEDACKQNILKQVANNIKKLSSQEVSGFSKIDTYKKINEEYLVLKNKKLDVENILDDAMALATEVQSQITKANKKLVFCHADLNPRNIFVSDSKILFIDWEDSGLNYEFFDLADYSVFSCLKPSANFYLLKKYLQKEPSEKDMQFFNSLKTLIRIYDAFSLLSMLVEIPPGISIKAIKEFNYYQSLFASQNYNSPEFLYSMALGQLKEIVKY